MVWLFNIGFVVGILQAIFFPVAEAEVVLAFWPQLAMMAAGTLMSMQNQKQQAGQQRRGEEMNAIETQYSPWINPQYRDVTPAGSKMGAALGGGLQGYMMGSQLKGGWGAKPSEKTNSMTPQRVDKVEQYRGWGR